jgi:dUTP pyrophosphatase
MRLPIRYLPNYDRSQWGDVAYARPGDAGFDLRAAVSAPVTVPFGAVVVVATGIALAVPEGHEIQVRPRSGLAAKRGITLVNAPGTIDSGYRGEIQVILACLMAEGAVLEPGERIAQAVLCPVRTAAFAVVEVLDETERGAGGLGSTGT